MKHGIDEALRELVPTGTWTITNEVYSGIAWHDTSFTKPTEEEVNAKITELNNAEPMKLLRDERNLLLSESDWIIVKSQETGVAISNEWKTYRQALRDLPASSTPKLDENFELDFSSVTWPTKPE